MKRILITAFSVFVACQSSLSSSVAALEPQPDALYVRVVDVGAGLCSSTAFVQAVHPPKVIFSAGHKFEHPRALTAQRYLSPRTGVSAGDVFRTDHGDNEGGKEFGPLGTTPDKTGDDDVDILVTPDGKLQVAYRNN